jgi:hypothetical protein
VPKNQGRNVNSPPQPSEAASDRRIDSISDDSCKMALSELALEVDRQLASLRKGGAREKIEAIFASDGRTLKRPKAGPSY